VGDEIGLAEFRRAVQEEPQVNVNLCRSDIVEQRQTGPAITYSVLFENGMGDHGSAEDLDQQYQGVYDAIDLL
jgi:hypothetical protein